MSNLIEVKQQIHDYEYFANGLHHLNNAGVSVYNLKHTKEGYRADIVLHLDDIKERYNGCTYPDNFMATIKTRVYGVQSL